MYYRITKIYYRKTVGHLFTKPVQIEGTQKFFPPVSCFSSQFTFLPLGDASVCSEKMAALGESAFCAKYAKDPPTDMTIRAWHKQFTETGCLCKQKSSGHPLTAQDDVERVRASFLHSPKKSTGTAAKELLTLKTTAWRVLRKRLVFSCYKCL
jgi:hypothetical protein